MTFFFFSQKIKYIKNKCTRPLPFHSHKIISHTISEQTILHLRDKLNNTTHQQSLKFNVSSVRATSRVQLLSLLFVFVFKATDYRLDPLASLLVGVVLLCGVGILEGFPPCWRDAERGVVLDDSPTVSDTSEHTD